MLEVELTVSVDIVEIAYECNTMGFGQDSWEDKKPLAEYRKTIEQIQCEEQKSNFRWFELLLAI